MLPFLGDINALLGVLGFMPLDFVQSSFLLFSSTWHSNIQEEPRSLAKVYTCCVFLSTQAYCNSRYSKTDHSLRKLFANVWSSDDLLLIWHRNLDQIIRVCKRFCSGETHTSSPHGKSERLDFGNWVLLSIMMFILWLVIGCMNLSQWHPRPVYKLLKLMHCRFSYFMGKPLDPIIYTIRS